jgi:nitrite reductase (NADH) small subunit
MTEQLVGPADGLQEGSITIVEVNGVEVGVLRVLGQIRAFENRCAHQGGPVCYGEILGHVEAVLDDQKRIVSERFSEERFNLICPWHGWSYDPLTGECIADRRIKLKSWEVVERDGQIYLRLPTKTGR